LNKTKTYKTFLSFLFLALCSILNAQKLSYGNPSEVQMDSLFIYQKVDSIITDAIQKQAFPGVQILVARKHKIIFHKTYGFHTYDSVQKAKLNDVYDIASVTKILGPLPAIMKLYDEGKIDLDAPFSNYWKPWENRKNKKDLTVREILAHQAGLHPYIVFLSEVLKKDNTLKSRFVKNKLKNRFTSQAYDGIFIKDRFKNKMYRQINRSTISIKKKYKYSGLSFLLYPKIISDITNENYTD